jgi:hypothetical protein
MEDKSERVRAKGKKNIREQCMGFLAGRTLDPFNGNALIHPNALLKREHIPLIGTMRCEAVSGTTTWANVLFWLHRMQKCLVRKV